MKRVKENNRLTIIETSDPFNGLKNGDERLAKVKLAVQINDRLSERGITQKEAGKLLGITQPEVSKLKLVRLSGFTFDRLYRCLVVLDMDIEISVKKHLPRKKATPGVHVI